MKIDIDYIRHIYFTSDLHLYHKNIINMSNRPFNDIDEMNSELINNWNNTVSEEDIVFILGDFIFTGNIQKISDILDLLKGTKYLILGNHDYRNKLNRENIKKLFAGVYDLFELSIKDEKEEIQRVILTHYPLCTWNKKYKGSYNLHGHIHSGPNSTSYDKYLNYSIYQYDVGVDNNNYRPISFYNIDKIIKRKEIELKQKYYTGNIEPEKNTIFVFGSNPQGIHGAGSAKVALEKFGAMYGKGEGLQNNSYALPTVDIRIGKRSISPQDIIQNIKNMYNVAKINDNKLFKVAYRNNLNEITLNGYSGKEMIMMFILAGPIPKNVIFSKEWIDTGYFS